MIQEFYPFDIEYLTTAAFEGNRGTILNIINDPNCNTFLNLKNSRKQTMLYCACIAEDNFLMVQDLLNTDGIDINATQERGSTPLHGAVWSNHKESVILLLAAGCDTTIKNINNATAEEEADQKNNQEIIDIFKWFREKNKDMLLTYKGGNQYPIVYDLKNLKQTSDWLM
jgi:ankyrin repeat protein